MIIQAVGIDGLEKTHDEFREKYFDMLSRHISDSQTEGISLLDKDSLDEIMEQEESVEKSKKKIKDDSNGEEEK